MQMQRPEGGKNKKKELEDEEDISLKNNHVFSRTLGASAHTG
jgi:hypothetical protein